MSNKIHSLKDLERQKRYIKRSLKEFEESMKEDLEKMLHPSLSVGHFDSFELPFNVSDKTSKKISKVSNAIQLGMSIYSIYKTFKRKR